MVSYDLNLHFSLVFSKVEMCFGMFIDPLSFLFCVIPIQNFHQFLSYDQEKMSFVLFTAV